MMRIEVITAPDDFLKLKGVWNRLLAESANDNVYLRHEWFECWWEAFGKNKQLFVIRVTRGGETLGVAPLSLTRSRFRGIPVRVLEFMANEDSPRCDFILGQNSESVLENMFSILLRDPIQWDVIWLKNLPEDSPNFQGMKDLFSSWANRHLILPGLTSPYIPIATDWETYRKRLSPKIRKTLRNINNRFRKAGGYEIASIENRGGLEDLASVAQRSWKGRQGKAFTSRLDRKVFFELLTQRASDLGWLSVWCLYQNKIPIAYEYHLRYKNKETALLSDFDSAYKNYSPGVFLDHYIVSTLFKKGVEEYDLCGSFDSYKTKWKPEIRHHKEILLFNKRLTSRVLFFLEASMVPSFKALGRVFSGLPGGNRIAEGTVPSGVV